MPPVSPASCRLQYTDGAGPADTASIVEVTDAFHVIVNHAELDFLEFHEPAAGRFTGHDEVHDGPDATMHRLADRQVHGISDAGAARIQRPPELTDLDGFMLH
ncbi:MAG: hypothetical protein F4Y60_06120 [Boseongicola sp. SB0664_bin_43]|uniref:Uncharacterized protein n=1 Tax=Boseongicola sp. SB0664_bin_43 TaxID=2604844 RepID=A0A6B0Y3P2_9RHOB|nr:hypothetical protein [Boseongicola sp. SB0664_bin_43]MYK32999.1 hypothetical protein [Boseongicola sp. SB0670_bin_30]